MIYCAISLTLLSVVVGTLPKAALNEIGSMHWEQKVTLCHLCSCMQSFKATDYIAQEQLFYQLVSDVSPLCFTPADYSQQIFFV